MPLFTSNSERHVPWALIGAVVLLGCLEFGLRVLAGPTVLPCTRKAPEAYDAIRVHLDRLGAEAVAIVGSSRAREAFIGDALTVSEAPVPMGNYAASGARAVQVGHIVRTLLNAEPPPRLIVYGVTPYQFSTGADLSDLDARLSSISEWRAERAADATKESLRSHVVRTELARHWLTFAVRSRIGEWFSRWLESDDLTACHIRGELTPFQRTRPDRSLVNRPVTPERVRDYLGRCMVDGHYPLADDQTQALRRLAREARSAEVPLVIVELPLSKLLMATYPDSLLDDFRDRIRRIAHEEDIPLVLTADLILDLGDSDFLEQSHLNLAGARRFNRALAVRLAPALSDAMRLHVRRGEDNDLTMTIATASR